MVQGPVGRVEHQHRAAAARDQLLERERDGPEHLAPLGAAGEQLEHAVLAVEQSGGVRGIEVLARDAAGRSRVELVADAAHGADARVGRRVEAELVTQPVDVLGDRGLALPALAAPHLRRAAGRG